MEYIGKIEDDEVNAPVTGKRGTSLPFSRRVERKNQGTTSSEPHIFARKYHGTYPPGRYVGGTCEMSRWSETASITSPRTART